MLYKEINKNHMNCQSRELDNMEPKLSVERAEEILRNVYKAVGVTPPENCSEILRKGRKE